MSQTIWEADKMLDVYIYDHLMKRKLLTSAKAFQAEGKVSTDPVAIDAPGGFLFEWWSVFWDIFIARSNEKHSEAATAYIEAQVMKARGQQQKPLQQHAQMQQMMLQRHAQQQQQQVHRDGIQFPNGTGDGLPCSNTLMRQNSGPRFGDNTGQVLDPNHASVLKSPALSGYSSGQILRGSPGSLSGGIQQVQNRAQQLSLSAHEMKPELTPIANFRASESESLGGVQGFNQGVGNVALKGWPLTSQQPMFPLHIQQQLLLQAQRQHASSSPSADMATLPCGGDSNVPVKDPYLQHPDKLSGFGNDLGLKTQTGRKRKHPGSSSGPSNSSDTGNSAGLSPGSPPSTQTSGDVAALPHVGSSSSRPLGTATLPSSSNRLNDIDRFMDDSLDDNVGSFLSVERTPPVDDARKGLLTFSEIARFCASTSKVECCHLSSDGKLLVTAGPDRKAVMWHTESRTRKSALEEHSLGITDVRFSPDSSRLATASHDRTVRVWDVDNAGYSLRTFMGHAASATSVDFHPNKEDLICSCDDAGEIRYWSINNGSGFRMSTGGVACVRFQPRHGRLLAAVADNCVSLFDVETQACKQSLQGQKNLKSVNWDSSGEYLACVSDDAVKVWRVGIASEPECLHELAAIANHFYSAVFHPAFPSVLLIGAYQSIEVWDIKEKKRMSVSAHDSQVSSMAVSNSTGLVASCGHDKFVKLWK